MITVSPIVSIDRPPQAEFDFARLSSRRPSPSMARVANGPSGHVEEDGCVPERSSAATSGSDGGAAMSPWLDDAMRKSTSRLAELLEQERARLDGVGAESRPT